MMTSLIKSTKWVPGVYMMQGLPFACVSGMAAIFYKDLGLSNSKIAFYTSLYTLPWVLKFFLAPLFEGTIIRKNVIILMQCIMCFFILLLAINTYFFELFYLSSIIFLGIALAGSLHDINSDGLYLKSLSPATQAKCIGIKTIFYQIGVLISQSGAIYAAGTLLLFLDQRTAWSMVFLFLWMGMLFITAFNYKMLPRIVDEKKVSSLSVLSSYRQVLKEFAAQPHVFAIVIFLLFFHFPDLQLMKIMPLFMLDNIEAGGLGLSMKVVGVIYGGIGLVSMLMGITLSGFLLARFPLRVSLVYLTIISLLGNMTYLLLVFTTHPALWLVSCCVIAGQFGFGLSNGAYMFYLIHIVSQTNYSISLYAIGTAIMLLGGVIAGSISGYIQSLLGYGGFFIWIVITTASIVGLAKYNARRIL